MSQYGIFYKSNGKLTKRPYLGEVYDEKSIKTYFKNLFPNDKKTLKSKIYVRKLRNGKRH